MSDDVTNLHIMHAIGEIQGELKGINHQLADHGQRLRTIHDREVKAARAGASSGGVVALLVTAFFEGIKHLPGNGG